MESYCKVFNTTVSFHLICTCLKIYVILSKCIIKAEVCYLLKCYILVGVNDLMLHLVRLSPLLYLYYIFLLQLQEDHEAPANPKTDSLQMFFSGAQRRTRCTYVLRHPPGTVFITFEIWIFFLQKHMDSLQEAFIHPPKTCEACFIMDVCALFDVLWTVQQKHPPTAMMMLGMARTIFNITPIGFVWKKKVIYT